MFRVDVPFIISTNSVEADSLSTVQQISRRLYAIEGLLLHPPLIRILEPDESSPHTPTLFLARCNFQLCPTLYASVFLLLSGFSTEFLHAFLMSFIRLRMAGSDIYGV
jgi:hypothetical protein